MLKSIQINGKFCSPEVPVIPATLARHKHVISYWNQDDPSIEYLPFMKFCILSLSVLTSKPSIYNRKIVIKPYGKHWNCMILGKMVRASAL